MKVRYRGRALADLEQIFQYIDKRSPSGARNVIDEIHATSRPDRDFACAPRGAASVAS
jgi:plasmid stabilization system protein ParE